MSNVSVRAYIEEKRETRTRGLLFLCHPCLIPLSCAVDGDEAKLVSIDWKERRFFNEQCMPIVVSDPRITLQLPVRRDCYVPTFLFPPSDTKARFYNKTKNDIKESAEKSAAPFPVFYQTAVNKAKW